MSIHAIRYEEVYGIQGVDTILRGTLRFEGCGNFDIFGGGLWGLA